MDALEKAISMAESAKDSSSFESWNLRVFTAQAYAAIAQAEQLKRIADMMENYLAIYGDPAVLSNLGKQNG